MGRVYVICVGNDLNGDDGAGLIVHEGIEGIPKMKSVFAYTAPENFTDDIIDYAPERAVLVDAADFGAEHGTVANISLDSIQQSHFSTHRAPFKILADALAKDGIPFSIVGIQVRDTGLGMPMTDKVLKACEGLVKDIKRARA